MKYLLGLLMACFMSSSLLSVEFNENGTMLLNSDEQKAVDAQREGIQKMFIGNWMVLGRDGSKQLKIIINKDGTAEVQDATHLEIKGNWEVIKDSFVARVSVKVPNPEAPNDKTQIKDLKIDILFMDPDMILVINNGLMGVKELATPKVAPDNTPKKEEPQTFKL